MRRLIPAISFLLLIGRVNRRPCSILSRVLRFYLFESVRVRFNREYLLGCTRATRTFEKYWISRKSGRRMEKKMDGSKEEDLEHRIRRKTTYLCERVVEQSTFV